MSDRENEEYKLFKGSVDKPSARLAVIPDEKPENSNSSEKGTNNKDEK